MIDYIIVGLGLAGISMCEQLEKHHKSYLVFENNSQQSSTVAAGLYNPVILKRFTAVWNADEQLTFALPFYKEIEKKFNTVFDEKIEVLRRFTSIEEQNKWFEASDKPLLAPYLDTNITKEKMPCVKTDFGFGRVKQTGRVHTKKLLQAYRTYLKSEGKLIEESFDYDELVFKKETVRYKTMEVKKVVFCEGFGLKKNPYFNYLPLHGTKGELITIKATKLKLTNVLKSSVFIIPEGNNTYKVGATYHWTDKTNTPTQEAKQELIEKLNTFVACEYEIIDHVAGIRPTVIDRKPLVGLHPKYSQLAILNGLGTRGVMIAPLMGEKLYNYIENKNPLPEEIQIARFEELYEAS